MVMPVDRFEHARAQFGRNGRIDRQGIERAGRIGGEPLRQRIHQTGGEATDGLQELIVEHKRIGRQRAVKIQHIDRR